MSSQLGLKFVSPPSSVNLSVPWLGHWPEWMKRLSSLVPVARTTGLSGEAPSSARSESRMIGWQEPSRMPGWISRRWWQDDLKYFEPSWKAACCQLPTSFACAGSRLSVIAPVEP